MGLSLDLRALTLATVLVVAVGCTPDHFSYDNRPGGSSGTSGCDTDGCPPECPLGSVRNAGGECEPLCGDWRTSLDVPIPTGIAVDDTRVIAAGTSFGVDGRPAGAQFFDADVCQGKLQQGTVPVKNDVSSAAGAAIVNGVIYVGGSQGADANEGGFISELDAETLAPKTTTPLPTIGTGAALVDLAATASSIWVTGDAGPTATSEPWLGRLALGGSACSAKIAGGGHARAIAARDTTAVVVLEKNDTLDIVSFDEASCAPPSCACQPASSPIGVGFPGADRSFASDLVLVDRIGYVVGYADAGGTAPFGYVLAVDLDAGGSVGFFRWDPSPTIDALFAGASDGKRFFAAGSSAAQGFDDLNDGTAALIGLDLPLTDDASAVWTWTTSDSTRFQAIGTLTADDAGVFALGAIRDGRSVLRRCSKNGC